MRITNVPMCISQEHFVIVIVSLPGHVVKLEECDKNVIASVHEHIIHCNYSVMLNNYNFGSKRMQGKFILGSNFKGFV